MARCQGWRPTLYEPHRGQGHVPFGTDGGTECRRCWRPCRERVESGQTWCRICLDALEVDPRPLVRRSLATDPACPPETLAFLVQDGDETVSLAARQAIEARGIDLDDATEKALATTAIDLSDDPWSA